MYGSCLSQVLEAVLKECRKENWSYKMEALKCIGEILETHSVDKFKEVWDIVSPILKKVSDTYSSIIVSPENSLGYYALISVSPGGQRFLDCSLQSTVIIQFASNDMHIRY